MRVAWLTPYLPAPENSGGRIRAARLAAGFGAGDDLHLYSRLSEHDAIASGGVEPFPPWHSVHAYPGQARRAPWDLRPYAARAMPGALRRALAADDTRQPFDAVVVFQCYAAEALPPLRRAAIVVDEQNVESDYSRRELGSGAGGRRRATALIEYLRTWRYERAVWRRGDRITTVSAADAAAVARAAPAGAGSDWVAVVPNGTSVDRFRFIPPSQRRGNKILYVGMMGYPPNVEAVKLLAGAVLPALRRRVPDATLTIAGRAASPEVRALAGEHVRVLGTLPDVFGLFDDHAAYAVPLSLGAGSSLKVLEPLAAGVPLVASAFAVRGQELGPRDYLRAETVDELVAALERALTRRAELDEMAARGRAIAERFAWSTSAASFARIVRQAVEARATGG
jgi:glycosyltransferase involved in cell wall biosynthesis